MNTTHVKPLFDYVLIKPLEAETKTPSGIVLPENAQEKPQMGLVIAVGPGKIHPDGKKEKMVVEKQQRVLYKKWAGNEVKFAGVEHVLVEQKDIMAIVE